MNDIKQILINSLNDEQKAVANDLSKELIVPAGAGSGKTKTLVTKFIYLLAQGHDLDSFLVLTFTKKAASEMKERIKKELNELNMDDLVNKIDSANISTFDAYAFNIVKQNAHLIGLNNDIDLLDDVVFTLTKQNIMEEIVLKTMTSNSPSIINFLNNYTYKLSSDGLLEELIKVYSQIKSKYRNLSDINIELLKPYEKDFIDIKTIKQTILDNYEDFYNDNQDKIDSIFLYANYLNNDDFDKVDILTKRYKWPKLDEVEKKQFQNEINSLFNPIIDANKKGFARRDVLNIYNLLDESLLVLLEILKEFDFKLNEFKQSTNKYEFDDIANFLNQLLETSSDLKMRIKDKLKFVFIDEYQDTSMLQTTFLNHLIENNDNIHVMYVGDIKQSIYKFRNAVPQSFIDKQKSATNIGLSYNYRSYHDIINFVNNLFEKLMSDEEKHDIVYKNGHKMIPKHDEKSDLFNGVYSLIFNDLNDEKKHYAKEAFVMGKEILKLKEDKKIDSFSKVTILARNKKDFKVVSDVFKYLDIPIEIQIDVNINDDYLLKLLSNILMFSLNINNINDDNIKNMRFWYLSIARSPLFNFDEKRIFKNLINEHSLGKIKPILSIDQEIYNKALKLNQVINNSSNVIIIDKLLLIFDVYNNISNTFDLETKNYQINFLYTLAQTLTDLNILGFDFVSYIYKMAYDDKLPFKQSVLYDDSSDSVKITNIHQSKGLEYEVLFIMNLDENFKKLNKYIFNYSDETNILFKPNFNNNHLETVYKNMLNYHYNNRILNKYNSELKEELRLLYVATTRAKRALYLNINLTDSAYKLENFRDYLLNIDFLSLINKENIIDKSDTVIDDDYYDELRADNEYYDSRIEQLEKYEFKFVSELETTSKASISTNNLIDESLKLSLNYGNELHLDFEFANFYDLNTLSKNPLKFSKHVFNNKTLSQALDFLTEYQFSVSSNNKVINGIVDLLVIYEDEAHIIDYKTKNIDNLEYINQLKVYKEHLEKVYDKKVFAFLYSIIDDDLRMIL